MSARTRPRGAASAQTRGTASAGRAPPQTKNSNSGQVSAEGAGNRGGRDPAGAQTKARVPHDARPRLRRGPHQPPAGQGPGPSAGMHPLPACRHVGRRRRDTGSPRAWLAGETGWAERRGPLLGPRASRGGGRSPVPGPRSPESLPRATSAHSPRGRPGSEALCWQLPLVLRREPEPEPEPGGMDAGGGARAPAASARRGGPSPGAPCLAGARAGDAHVRRAASARSGRLSGRAGPPAPSAAARAGEGGVGGGGGRTAGGRAGGGESAGGRAGRGGGGARAGPTNPAPRRGSARAGP